MATSSITDRLPNESENKYIMRLGNLKSSGVLDLTWHELAEIINKEFREPDEYYSESVYRKRFNLFKNFEEEFGGATESADAAELRELRRELEKERIKVRDERNEYKRLLREQARKESYQEQFVRAVTDAASSSALEYDDNAKFTGILRTDKDMIISLTDIHCGIKIDNFWNKYNEDILKQRLNHYLDRIFEIQLRHGCQDAFVVISESLSGIIRTTLRIENNQDVIDQFITVTDYIADFLAAICYRFDTVHVYVTPGNHSRVTPNKKESIPHENLDNLIPKFLESKLKNYKNIYVHSNDIEQGIAMFATRGLNVAAVHGDLDNPDTVVDKLSNLTKIHWDVILLGHRHTNGYWTKNNVKVIQSGCLSGTDNFAISMRLNNVPEQAVIIIDEKEGLDCIYDIKFKE